MGNGRFSSTEKSRELILETAARLNQMGSALTPGGVGGDGSESQCPCGVASGRTRSTAVSRIMVIITLAVDLASRVIAVIPWLLRVNRWRAVKALVATK